MRATIWLGSAGAAALFAAAAVFALRGTPPPTMSGVSPQSSPVAAAPAPPSPHQLAAAPPKPSFDIVTVDRGGQAVIAGRAAPGDRVRILDGGKPLGEVTADARGEWVLVPTTPMAPGNRQLTLDATAPGGNTVRRSDDVVALSVIRPTAPGQKPSAFAVLLPGATDQPARVLQEPEWASSVRKLLSLETATYGAGHKLVLAGHAEAGAVVRVYAGDKLLGTVRADAAGHWSLASAQAVPEGGFELWVDQLDKDGGVASRIGAPFEPPTGVALAKGGSYVVQKGNSLWVIARELYGDGERYTVIYSANRGQIGDPNLIYPGQQISVPKTANAQPAH